MIVVRKLSLLFALLALSSALLTACADDGTDMSDAPPQAVEQTPPLPPVEIPPLIQDPQAEIWRPGYWILSGGIFQWVPGKIIPRPSPTAVWHSANWMRHNYGWSFQEGHWE